MDKEEQPNANTAQSRALALAVIPHLEAITQLLGHGSRVSLTAVFMQADGRPADFVMGNGDFVESAFILLKGEVSRSASDVESVIGACPVRSSTKH